MAATTLQLRRLSKQSCIWKGKGGSENDTVVRKTSIVLYIRVSNKSTKQRNSQITASVQTLNDSVPKQFIQGKNKNRIQLQKTTMFIALASVQQRRTKEDKRCHKITGKGYLKTKDNKTTDIYIYNSVKLCMLQTTAKPAA